jgi:hypothetical protein
MFTDRTLEDEDGSRLEDQLARLVICSPKLAELPITPLFGGHEPIHLEIALARFSHVHRSEQSRQLVAAVRTLLGVARARVRIASNARRSIRVADIASI